MRRNQNFVFGREGDLRLKAFQFLNFFPLFFSFVLLGLLAVKKTSKKESSRRPIFSMEQLGVVAGNFALSFSLIFLAFLCISQAPLGRSL